MNIDLNDYYIFVQVVEHNSFKGAATSLGMARSSVCRRIARLEEQLKVNLILRTSRHFTVTDIGQEFYRSCQKMIAEAKAATDGLARMRGTASGPLHISCAPIAHPVVSGLISSFKERHPEVQVAVITDHSTDTHESFHLRIRAQHSSSEEESGQLVRSLGSVEQILVAKSELLDQIGRPSSPEEASRLPTLGYGSRRGPHVWKMLGPDAEVLQIRHRPMFIADDIGLVREAALSGLGIAQLPRQSCQTQIMEKRLEVLLPEFVEDTEIWVSVPSKRGVLVPEVKVFLNFLEKWAVAGEP